MTPCIRCYAPPAVHAAWLGGSDATGRTDRYSDVDCQALVDNEAVEAVITAVTAALNALSPIDRAVPHPGTHLAWALANLLSPARRAALAAGGFSCPEDEHFPANRFLEPERH
ncbi:MAG: hypothetical protein IPJ94_26480, partial [Chloroflexi bacterium]|nr:hypothetical protein [Chloroflexota bacterium]